MEVAMIRACLTVGILLLSVSGLLAQEVEPAPVETTESAAARVGNDHAARIDGYEIEMRVLEGRRLLPEGEDLKVIEAEKAPRYSALPVPAPPAKDLVRSAPVAPPASTAHFYPGRAGS